MNGYRLKAFRVNHNVLCYGYTHWRSTAPADLIPTRAKGRTDPTDAIGSSLQKGETVEYEGRILTAGYGAWSAAERDQIDLYDRYAARPNSIARKCSRLGSVHL